MFEITEQFTHTLERLSGLDSEATINMHTVRASSKFSTEEDDFLPQLLQIYEQSIREKFFSIDVQQRIGIGGSSVIDSAKQVSLERDIAIKRLRPDQNREEDKKALIAEAKLLAKLDHPNILPVHILGFNTDGDPVLVMKKVL